MYLIYEFMHFCCHVEENWFVRNCPFVNTLRRHHTAHHNARLMMEVNMNLTFPIADWLFGTSDLDRGLLGHLFNGYETRFLKREAARRAAPSGRSGGRARGLVLRARFAPMLSFRGPSVSEAARNPQPQAIVMSVKPGVMNSGLAA